METHDPLCPNAGLRWEKQIWCACALIAKVRADEREQHPGIFDVISGSCGHTWLAQGRGTIQCPICFDVYHKVRAQMTDLRAKVEAMQVLDDPLYGYGPLLWRSEVLALIDGGSDE